MTFSGAGRLETPLQHLEVPSRHLHRTCCCSAGCNRNALWVFRASSCRYNRKRRRATAAFRATIATIGSDNVKISVCPAGGRGREVANKRAKERLDQMQNPLVVPADETFDTTKTIELGGTTLELSYLGLNHSDSNIVMRLPREKIVFIVDTIPVGQVPGRGFIDMYPLEAEDFIKKVIAMDWERLIPGHPGVNVRLGTKQDARDQLRLLEEASAEMKPLGIAGKCWAAEKDLKLSSFKDWPGYQQGLEFIGRRYCGVWGRGT